VEKTDLWGRMRGKCSNRISKNLQVRIEKDSQIPVPPHLHPLRGERVDHFLKKKGSVEVLLGQGAVTGKGPGASQRVSLGDRKKKRYRGKNPVTNQLEGRNSGKRRDEEKTIEVRKGLGKCGSPQKGKENGPSRSKRRAVPIRNK